MLNKELNELLKDKTECLCDKVAKDTKDRIVNIVCNCPKCRGYQ